MRRVLSVVVASCALAMLQACQSDVASPAAEGSSTPTVAPTPTPTADLTAELTAAVNRAQLRPQEVDGVAPKGVDPETLLPCRVVPTALPSVRRGWAYPDTKLGRVSHTVLAYDPQLGTAIVDEHRAALGACTSWEETFDARVKIQVGGEFALARPAGADNSLAYCETLTFLSGPVAGENAYSCEIVVSRGPLVATISVSDITGLKAAKEKLTKAAPLAGSSLVRAMPVL